MTPMTCEQVVEQYIQWLRDNSTVRDVEGICEITTPFLDRHNDHLVIYVKRQGDQFVLTDDGYVLADLEQSGVEITTERRRSLLNTILNGFGVQQNDAGELFVVAQVSNLPQKKHNLMQAMLAVGDMFAMARDVVLSLFAEDVERWLRSKQIRFTPQVKIPGKSTFDHTINVLIPASAKAPERLARVVNRATRDQVQSLLFSVSDIQPVRSVPFKAYLIFNDEEQPLSPEANTALANYEINAIPWSRREEHVDILGA